VLSLKLHKKTISLITIRCGRQLTSKRVSSGSSGATKVIGPSAADAPTWGGDVLKTSPWSWKNPKLGLLCKSVETNKIGFNNRNLQKSLDNKVISVNKVQS
jgi:hypothetical protein